MKRATIRTCLIVLLTAVLETSFGLKAQASPDTVVITELSDTQLTVKVGSAAAVTYTTTIADFWQFSLVLPGLIPGAYGWGWAEPGKSTTGNTVINGVGIVGANGMFQVGTLSDVPVSLPAGSPADANDTADTQHFGNYSVTFNDLASDDSSHSVPDGASSCFLLLFSTATIGGIRRWLWKAV
jgi:hypothetical protein